MMELPGQRIRIVDDYYAQKIKGKLATVVKSPFTSILIAKVDGLAPYGQNGGEWAFAPTEYELA